MSQPEITVGFKNLNAINQMKKALRGYAETASNNVEIGWTEDVPEKIRRRAWLTEFRSEKSPGYLNWAILRKTRLNAMKNASADLALILRKRGLRGKAALNVLGEIYEELLRSKLWAVDTPPLMQSTVDKKRRMGIAPPLDEKVWVESGETEEAITHRVVKRVVK